MRGNKFELRCYIEKQGNLFVAVCIDLSLAAQADSMDEARRKLDLQIVDYLNDVLNGPEREHIKDLLPRKAPLSQQLRYQVIRLVCKVERTLASRPKNRKPHATAFNEFWPSLIAH